MAFLMLLGVQCFQCSVKLYRNEVILERFVLGWYTSLFFVLLLSLRNFCCLFIQMLAALVLCLALIACECEWGALVLNKILLPFSSQTYSYWRLTLLWKMLNNPLRKFCHFCLFMEIVWRAKKKASVLLFFIRLTCKIT